MNFRKISGLTAVALALGVGGCSVFATGDIARDEIPVPNIPFVAAVAVPPGFTTYYISGTLAAVADPSAPAGSVQRLGDTETQTTSVLIASNFGDATKSQLSALLAAGFVLFLITIVVNTGAAVVIRRSRSGMGTDL